MNASYGPRSLREITRILFQHWFLLLLIVAVGTVGTWAYCYFVAARTYRSRVSLMFKRPLDKSPISTDKSERALEVFVKVQQQIVMSDLVLARAKVIAEDPALREKWYRLHASGPKLSPEKLEFLTKGEQRKGTVAHGVRRLLTEDQAAFNKFRKSVELETPGGEQVALTESFTVIVDRPDTPENARHAADILADMYVVRFQALQQELNDPAVKVMEDIIAEYGERVKGRLSAYQAFVNENPADIGVLEQLLKSGTEHGVQILLSKVRENDANLSVDLARDRAVRDVLKKVLPAIVFKPGGIKEMSEAQVVAAIESTPLEFMEGNDAIVELGKNLAKLGAKRARLKSQFAEASRNVRYIDVEIDQAKRHLLRAIVAQARGLDASVQAREQQLAMNRELKDRSEAEQNEIHRKLVTYARLKNDFEVAQSHLTKLKQEKIDAISNSLRAREAVTIAKLNAASIANVDKPVSPKTLLYTIAAFLASSLLGVAFAFFLDHFDHTLRSSFEAERYLGLPVLGSIKKRGRGLVVSM